VEKCAYNMAGFHHGKLIGAIRETSRERADY
jgi:hypothetical protein